MKSLLLLPLLAISLLTSCGSFFSHESFVNRSNYKQIYKTYENKTAQQSIDTSKTKIVINIATQRMIVSQGPTVLIDTPCTTGRLGKRTPLGTFKLYDKKAKKRSTVYGTIYRNGRRVCGGHRFERCPGVRGTFVGSPLPYWQRLTSNGIGMHASNYVKRYPASGGCIRLQPAYAKKIFYLTKNGTPVTVTNS